jgi:hypothetical protein
LKFHSRESDTPFPCGNPDHLLDYISSILDKTPEQAICLSGAAVLA